MSGPARVPSWYHITRALAKSGVTLTKHGAALARLQTSCGWCGVRLHEGPLSASGQESTGICFDCASRYFEEHAND